MPTLPLMADIVQRAPQPDLRLLIDISGSMKESDPDNLRGPALELIVRLLPDGAKAGVWAFGQDVKVLVPHGIVDEVWRQQAQQAVAHIDNSGQRTNIPAVLAAATYDFGSLDPAYRTSIVLLTDGKVDVSASPIANISAAKKLLEDTAPNLAATGIPIHTIALSDHADWAFLRSLAEVSTGLADKAETAGDLTEIFVQSLEMVAPAARVPLAGGSFSIDDSVESFTALVFFTDTPADLGLVAPDGESFSAAEAKDNAEWFVTGRFALVSVKNPVPGSWQLEAPTDARIRVTVIADLQLEADPLPSSMPADRAGEIGIRLRSGDELLTDVQLLELLHISLDITGPDGTTKTIDVSADYPVPPTGEYRVSIPAFEQAGRYQLLARVQGKTLMRELPMYVDVVASPERNTINTRPEDVPETSLILPVLTLFGVLALVAFVAWLESRRRRRRKLAIWQRRFETSRDDEETVVATIRADSDDHQRN
ncbi:MAG: VWA domain-containing protein [Parahaliea sp.]